MKNKILGFILTLSMLISLLVPVTGVQAAMGIKHETEVSLMAALGIVPGYPDNYNADAAVTQKDFIKYAYAAVGTEISDPESFAKNLGLEGNEDITITQAAAVILKVTGYENIMGSTDAYTYAQSIKVFSGVSNAAAEAKVTTEAAAVMLYNVINMKAVELDNRSYVKTDNDIMEEKLDVYKETGIVTANNITALSGYGTTSDSSVRIENEVYNIGSTTAQGLLGKNVKFYYKDDDVSGEKVIKWIEVETTKTTTAIVYGCDVTAVTSESITFDSNTGSQKTLRIDKNADIIYNGVLTSSISIDVVRSLTCEATFIKNSNSSNYNVVIIKDYTYYLVDSFTSSTLTVNDFESKQSLDVDKGNYSSFEIYRDGVPANAEDIKTGDVLAVALSEDGTIISIEIIGGSVSGEITMYSSDSVVIGGMSYDISPAYAGDQLKNGRSGTFYFDKLGKIVRCVATKAQTSKYGYLMKYYSDSDGQSDYTARVLTAEGSVIEFKVNDSIKFNGNKKSSYDVYYLIDAGNNCEQLINYTVNSSNVIVTMDTADENYIGVDEQAIDEFTMNFKGAGRYRKNNMCFNSKYLIDSTTPIFFIPYNGEKEDYTVKDASYLVNNWTYDISVYDIDNYMYASAIVLRENIIEPENLRTKRCMIISKVFEAVDDDGEEGVMIEGYQQGSKASYFLYNPNMYENRGLTLVKTLTAGDVIQFGVDVNNKINAVQLLYRASTDRLTIASGTKTPNQYWEGGAAIFPDLWVTTGNVVDRNSEIILVDDDGDDTVVSKTPHKLVSTYTYIYENKKITVSNKNEISIGDTVYVHEYQGNVQDVLIVR